jgi:hypothetical protein
MARAKQDAVDADADLHAENTYGQAVREERRANNLRRSGRDEAAALSFEAAAERFKKSATEARLKTEDEEQDRLKKQKSEQRGQAPPSPPPAQKAAPLNIELEKDAVIQTLRRYELAYSSMSVAAVRSVHPGAAVDQLTKQFADARSYAVNVKFTGEIRFYTFSESRISAVAPATFIVDVITRGGQRNHEERAHSVTLEKQRGAWVITDIR